MVPTSTSRDDALRSVGELRARWPEQDDLWQRLTERVDACEPSEVDDLGGLLAAIAADMSTERPRSARGHQLPQAQPWIERHLARAGCPDPGALSRIMSRHSFYYRGRKTALRAILNGVIGGMPDAMRPLVAWGLSSPYGRITGSDGVAVWAGCRESAADLLARVRDPSPEVALVAAREIWRQAVRREGDLADFLSAMEEGLETSAPDGLFFLSCARRVLIRRQDPEAVLPSVIPAASSPPPVRYRIRTSFTTWEFMAGSAFEARRQFDDGTHQPHAVREGTCLVCASVRVTCVHCEAMGSNTGRWRLSELECDDCGCYSCHNDDD